jgi:hypothetical protein
MSKMRTTYWWLPGFAVSFLAVGVPYWRTPYNRLDLPNALAGTGLVVLVAAAALTRALSGRRSLTIASAIGSAVPAVVVSRVIVDVMRDPTSHNLWPFEVVIAVFAGWAAALAGAVSGGLMSRLRGGRQPNE